MSESQQKFVPARTLEVDPDQAGQRMDNFLTTLLKGVPRSYIYRIIRRGEVRVNKGRISASYRLQAEDRIRVPPMRLGTKEEPRKADSRQLARLEQAIIHEDKRILVLNKPSGMAVHGGSGLSFGIIEGLRQLRPGEKRLELVHRLDRETSGCLLIARKSSALRALHELLRENRIDKRYLALLHGSWKQDRLQADAPLLKNTLKSGERVVRVDPRGKSALTRFRVRERFPEAEAMLVEAELLTGMPV